MKFLGLLKFLIFAVALLAFHLTLGSNEATTQYLIAKFEKIYLQISSSDPARIPVTLRLADLLAEKARLLSMEELNQGCVDCRAGEADRTKAIEFYKEVLVNLNSQQRPRVLAQLGHLLELNQNSDEAREIYNKIIVEENGPELVAEAQLSLAEMEFKKYRFQEAYDLYQKVLDEPNSKRKALAAYRQAWCLFNLGRAAEATAKLEKILKTPSLLSKEDTEKVIDTHYHEEVAKDFATFAAKKGVELKDLDKVYQLSPPSVKLLHLSYLANELERLGQKSNAIAAFEFVLNKEIKPQERLHHHLQLAQLYKNQNDITKSLENFSKALSLQQSTNCADETCSEVFTRLRKYVIDWHALEKEQPTPALLSAYDNYIKYFPNEMDMALWQVEAFKQLKAWPQALKSMQRMQAVYKAGHQVKGKNNAQDFPDFENLLLMQVEIGEMSQEDLLKREAYNNYLVHSQKKTQNLAIQYQLAHLKYKNKEYLEAAEQFREIVNSLPIQDKKIQLQAADLALDSLVILKQESLLESWASEFAKVMPEKEQEYLAIARKALINQASFLAKQSSSLPQAWETLQRANVNNATTEDKVLYFKNRLILAEKLKFYAEARLAVQELLNLKSLSPEDRQWALSRQVWLSELALDFTTALKATKKINLKPYVPEAKDLKLALFSELSGQDAAPFYKSYLKQTRDKEQQAAIALKIAEASSEPLKTLESLKKYFDLNPELYANKIIEWLSLSLGPEQAFPSYWIKQFEKDKQLSKTKAYLFVWQHNFTLENKELISKLATHQFDLRNEKQMNYTLKQRLQLLEKLEGQAAMAIDKGAWFPQVYALHHLAKESQRFYTELLSLPMPEGLNDEQQMQYMQLLSQQAAPYKLKAEDVRAKEKNFWSAPNLVESLKQKYVKASEPLRPMLRMEIEMAAELAPDSLRSSLVEVASHSSPAPRLPTLAELEQAREMVRKDPLNESSLDLLIDLERRAENMKMVSYLTGRRQQLQDLKGASNEN